MRSALHGSLRRLRRLSRVGRGATIVMLTVIALAFAVGCSSREDSVENPTAPAGTSSSVAATAPATATKAQTLAPASADALAHNAIPKPEALPGGNWIVGAVDEFDSSDTNLGDIPACQDFASRIGGFGSDDTDEGLIGHAETDFGQETSDEGGIEIPPSIGVEVKVYAAGTKPEAPWNILQAVIDSPEFGDCIKGVGDLSLTDAPAGMEGGFEAAKSPVDPPQPGAAMGMHGSFSFLGFTFDITGGVYFWSYGDARVTTTIFGAPATVTPDFISQVLAAVDTSVQAAAGK